MKEGGHVSSDARIQLSKEEANLLDLKQGLREMQKQHENEEAFMRFIMKQANRVKIEEATLTKNSNNQTNQKQSKVAATTTDQLSK